MNANQKPLDLQTLVAVRFALAEVEGESSDPATAFYRVHRLISELIQQAIAAKAN